MYISISTYQCDLLLLFHWIYTTGTLEGEGSSKVGQRSESWLAHRRGALLAFSGGWNGMGRSSRKFWSRFNNQVRQSSRFIFPSQVKTRQDTFIFFYLHFFLPYLPEGPSLQGFPFLFCLEKLNCPQSWPSPAKHPPSSYSRRVREAFSFTLIFSGLSFFFFSPLRTIYMRVCIYETDIYLFSGT